MRRIDRFDKYMKVKGLNDNKVTIQLGLSVGTLGKSRKEGRDLSDKVIELILNFYKDLSRVWLLTGEGEMLCVGYHQTSCGNNSPNIHGDGNNVSIGNTAILEERVKALEALLAEKERVIKLYEQMTKSSQM